VNGNLGVSGGITATAGSAIHATGILTCAGNCAVGQNGGTYIDLGGPFGAGNSGSQITMHGNASVKGAVAVDGSLGATGGFYGKLSTNTWIHSTDDRPRLLYGANSHSYYRTVDHHVFRNVNDTDVFNIEGNGNTRQIGNLTTGNYGSWAANSAGEVRAYGNDFNAISLQPADKRIIAYNHQGGYITDMSIVATTTHFWGIARINGAEFMSMSAGWQMHAGGEQTWGGASENVGLVVESDIWCKYRIVVASDERIKKNISTVTDSIDIINKLNIVSYGYIDNMKEPVKHGLIAQQVQAIYPEAISKNKNYIPSVNSLAITYEDASENVIITSAVNHGLCINDKIKLYINHDDKEDTPDTTYEPIVLEIVSDTQFKVKKWDNFELNKTMLIYGKQIDDFLSIDKQQIGILAAGACQTLSGQVSTLQAENLAQASTIASLQSTMNAMLEKYPL
jgi:hypothetical protein